MPKKILFIIILQMSLKGWGFYPDEVVSNKPGFAKTHRILMHKSGSKSYFKERKPCGALVPITTFVIDKLFELGMVPHTATFKLKNKDGIVMKFYENYKSLKLTAAPIFENISVAKMSDLAITRYLAGSYDTSFYNYIYNKKTKDVKAIDNDGRPLQDGVYGDWPLVNYKKKEAQLKKIDFQIHLSNELSLEEYITKLYPFIR
ncbi:MAG: hypothetical protein HRT44_07245, partial [Bdellovibrionales bacterium]|nr:hypothetical protein [Bdellovibrionales bacterium]